MHEYPTVTHMKEQIAEDSTAILRGDEVQQYLLYAASGDVFFPLGADTPEKRRSIPKGITIEGARALIEKVQRSEYARTHWPKFYAGALTKVDGDVGLMNNSLEQMLTGRTFDGAFTDDEKIHKHTGPAFIHLANNGFAMQPQVVLHELAHVVEAFERIDANKTNASAHGDHFARTNITLIREFLSPDKAKELEDAFAFAGVKVAPATQDQPHMELR